VGRTTQANVALICHWPEDKPYWLEEALGEHGFRVTRFSRKWGRRRGGPLRTVRSYLAAIRLGSRVARFADKNNATVITDSDGHMAGVFAAILPPAQGLRRRPVLCANLILFDKPGILTSMRKLLYRLALRNPRTAFTVSSCSLRQSYADMLGADPERFLVLPDCYAPAHRSLSQHDPAHDGGYVFAGGEAARDWQTTIAAAQACPEIPFLLVARRRSWPNLALPSNVTLKLDIPLAEFLEASRNARLVLALLTNDVVTAGLIVVTHAALMGSLVIASRTAATEGYFPPKCADLLVPMHDMKTVVDRVRRYWNDSEARRKAAEDLRRFVIEAHSPEAYSAAMADKARHLQTASVVGARRT
jgi:hypothetical protein